MRALIVDDSRFMRRFLHSLLTRHGVECVEAADARQGLEYLRSSHPFTVLLVDWNMPVLTGLEMLRAVRADPALDTMKVVMVTTEAENDHIEAALRAGADEYLVKPFDEAGLLDKLHLAGVTGL